MREIQRAVPAPERRRRGAQDLHVDDGGPLRVDLGPDDHRVGDHVDVLVNLAGLESTAQVNESVAGRELAVDSVRKLPLGARNHAARGVAGVADGEDVARVVRIGNRVLGAADSAPDHVAERNFGQRFGGHEIPAQQAGNGLAMVLGNGRVKVEGACAGCVPLPAEGHDGEAVAQQPSVAGTVREVPIAAVDE